MGELHYLNSVIRHGGNGIEDLHFYFGAGHRIPFNQLVMVFLSGYLVLFQDINVNNVLSFLRLPH